MELSRRDSFALGADVSWIETALADYVTAKTGVDHPPLPMTDNQKAAFLNRAEIVWRWKFADYMLKGADLR